jgi:hypothetical protein
MGLYGDHWVSLLQDSSIPNYVASGLVSLLLFCSHLEVGTVHVHIVFFFLSVWTRVSYQLGGDGPDGGAMRPNVGFFLRC